MVKWLKRRLPTADSIEAKLHAWGVKLNIKHPEFWSLDCRAVARGVAAGLFICVIPLPMQMLLAALIAMVIRGNVAVAVAATWFSNPFTFFPITYFIYMIGRILVGGQNSKIIIVQQPTLSFNNFASTWSSITTWAQQFGKPFLVGVPFAAIIFALIGYWLVIIIWNVVVYLKKRYKHKV